MKKHTGKILKNIARLLIIVVVLLGAATLGSIAYDKYSGPALVNDHLDFTNRLVIPSLLEPTIENNTKIFTLKLQQGETEFFKDKKTTTWGANGSYLMPTLRADSDDNIEIRVTNQLDEHTTIHWHGMHLPASMDGVHQIIDPNETWKPNWQIRQQAATLWYHPHLMGKTGEHVYNGLAGMFIIDDENSDSLALPSIYGVDDIPLIVQDRDFDENKQLTYEEGMAGTFGPDISLGDTILVNGTVGPYVDVPAKKIRLRILNGSNARRYNFGFADNRAFYQIASDGGFLETPVERTRMLLAPAERAEIIVDMSKSDSVVLMSYEITEETNILQSAAERVSNNDADKNEEFKIVELRPQATDTVSPLLPRRLNNIRRYSEDEAAKTRRFVLGSHTINDKTMAIDRIDEIVKLNTTEIWEISNPSGSFHPFHIHDVQFQILDRNGAPPETHERGWKDTVFVGQDEVVRVIMEFKDYADPYTPYMFHCHILEHEDAGMMGQFVVIDDDSANPEVRTEVLEKSTELQHTQH